jgi:hypothetical protein
MTIPNHEEDFRFGFPPLRYEFGSKELEEASAMLEALTGIQWFIHAATYATGHKCLRRNSRFDLYFYPPLTPRENLRRTWSDACDEEMYRIIVNMIYGRMAFNDRSRLAYFCTGA